MHDKHVELICSTQCPTQFLHGTPTTWQRTGRIVNTQRQLAVFYTCSTCLHPLISSYRYTAVYSVARDDLPQLNPNIADLASYSCAGFYWRWRMIRSQQISLDDEDMWVVPHMLSDLGVLPGVSYHSPFASLRRHQNVASSAFLSYTWPLKFAINILVWWCFCDSLLDAYQSLGALELFRLQYWWYMVQPLGWVQEFNNNNTK